MLLPPHNKPLLLPSSLGALQEFELSGQKVQISHEKMFCYCHIDGLALDNLIYQALSSLFFFSCMFKKRYICLIFYKKYSIYISVTCNQFKQL